MMIFFGEVIAKIYVTLCKSLKKWTPPQVAQIVALHHSGLIHRKVARQLEMTRSAVFRNYERLLETGKTLGDQELRQLHKMIVSL